MKKMMILSMLMTIAITANALTHTEARHEAKYMTDKMTHELHLMPAQYHAVYDINFDYLRSVNHHSNAYGKSWKHRNRMLRRVLTASQYDRYIHMEHFYRPMPKPAPMPKPVPMPKRHAPHHRHHPAPHHTHASLVVHGSNGHVSIHF